MTNCWERNGEGELIPQEGKVIIENSKLEDEIKKLEIDLIYTLEIKEIINHANQLVEQKKFNNAFEEFNKASASTYNITDTNLREKESNKINKCFTCF